MSPAALTLVSSPPSEHMRLIMARNRCQEDLNSSPLENWRRLPPGRSIITWMKTIQQELKSNNLSVNETIDVAQHRSFWRMMSTLGATHSWWFLPEMKKEE